MVGITINTMQLRKLEKALGHIKNGVPKALAPAINRSLDKGRTEVKKEIRKVYIIKPGDIPIRVSGAKRTSLSGSIILSDSMLPLDKFFVTGGVNKKPLFARVKVGGGGTIASGFRVFPFAFRRVGPARLPIKRLLSISAPIMASQPSVGPAVNKAMGDTLDKRIDHEMKRVLASAGGK
jgi:hypothetical protein